MAAVSMKIHCLHCYCLHFLATWTAAAGQCGAFALVHSPATEAVRSDNWTQPLTHLMSFPSSPYASGPVGQRCIPAMQWPVHGIWTRRSQWPWARTPRPVADGQRGSDRPYWLYASVGQKEKAKAEVETWAAEGTRDTMVGLLLLALLPRALLDSIKGVIHSIEQIQSFQDLCWALHTSFDHQMPIRHSISWPTSHLMASTPTTKGARRTPPRKVT